MAPKYRASVLEEIGLSEETAVMLTKDYPWPELVRLIQQLDAYGKFFEPEDINARAGRGAPTNSTEFVDHCFIPMLWPHLYWTVRVDSEGGIREIGFQNQAEINFRNFDPSTVRVGLWTLMTIERLARSSKIVDGWDEEKVVRFDFDSSHFQGIFVFGLLTEWTKV